MPPTNVSSVWPPSGKVARNTRPAGAPDETSSRPPKGHSLRRGKPATSVCLFGDLQSDRNTILLGAHGSPIFASGSLFALRSDLCVGRRPNLECTSMPAKFPPRQAATIPPNREPLAAINWRCSTPAESSASWPTPTIMAIFFPPSRMKGDSRPCAFYKKISIRRILSSLGSSISSVSPH